MNTAKFALGSEVITPGACSAIARTVCNPRQFLDRHMSGDWGDLDDGDKRINDLAIQDNERILSAYHLGDGTKIYIITEADRSVTTILLPEEY